MVIFKEVKSKEIIEMRILKSILIVLIIPAAIYVVNALKDYTDAEMTLNTYESFFMSLLPFLVISLVVFGIFKAIQHGKSE